MSRNTQIIVFGGGCFWCTEAVFGELKGVISVMPGYAGGITDQPTYESVSGGNTGHAEVIKIEYDPQQISFRDMLTVFFATHDPTTLNRQGNDVGTQYRSVILYTDEEQKNESKNFIKYLNESDKDDKPIVTEVKPLEKFYQAEDYHRKYYDNNSDQPYCQFVISVTQAREGFPNKPVKREYSLNLSSGVREHVREKNLETLLMTVGSAVLEGTAGVHYTNAGFNKVVNYLLFPNLFEAVVKHFLVKDLCLYDSQAAKNAARL